MDYENNPGNLSKTLISAVALAFLLKLERLTGRKPIIYTGYAFAYPTKKGYDRDEWPMLCAPKVVQVLISDT
ncbi:hypothetical protein PPSQR21_027550 [Paenibacillus polymyxa SQR-21]|nr:hypothetical protein PPSQR21_027550 [Paenibacillus polymyxa SQR-21]